MKVGLRFTITEDNADMLPAMIDLCDAEGVDKFYLSHLVYAGRGNKNRGEDTERARTRNAMDVLIDRAWVAVAEDQPLEIVTGNNDADAVWFLRWVERNFPSQRSGYLLVGLYGGFCEGDAVLGPMDRRGRDAGHPPPTPAPAEGALRGLRLQGHLRRLSPFRGMSHDPAHRFV